MKRPRRIAPNWKIVGKLVVKISPRSVTKPETIVATVELLMLSILPPLIMPTASASEALYEHEIHDATKNPRTERTEQ